MMSKVHARPMRSALLRGMSSVFVAAAVTAAGSAAAQPGDGSSPDARQCPPLYVLGVQGTGESSPDASVSVDDGMLSAVLVPLLSRVGPQGAGHAYVPYLASFGGMVPGGPTPYSYSAAEGLDRLQSMAREIVGRCSHTELALIGYSQGAHVVSMFAQEVGAGGGAVRPDQVAAVALLADPTRGRAAPVFPGVPGKDRPDPAPDTAGTEVAELPRFSLPTPPGGGIGPIRDITENFGALTGRVASLCLPGDLACDAPTDSPLLHMIATMAGQVEFNPDDPVATLFSIAGTIQATLTKTLATAVTEDPHGYSLGTLSLTSEKTLSIRLAEAADPRVLADPESRDALLKLATAAFNTLLAITGTALALSTSEFSQIATAASADPLAGLTRLAQDVASASHHPPAQPEAFRPLTQIFDAVGRLGADNAELLDPHTWLRYADTVHRHGAYATAGMSVRSSTEVLADWFTAVARDLAGPHLSRRTHGPLATAPPSISAPTTPTASPPTLPARPSDTIPVTTPSPPADLPVTMTQPTHLRSAPSSHGTDRSNSRLHWLLFLIGLILLARISTAIRNHLRRPQAPATAVKSSHQEDDMPALIEINNQSAELHHRGDVSYTIRESITSVEPDEDGEIMRT
ncbi:cutinase family protein [Nocardia sp. BSTN01]|uniref:cutinase family protein n=1 Tax=Nocardia sp. BSTN01 TaxID=2783665 RepID=UPI00188E1E5C|nr:cutinase family protein [Nocardia sp. BSTN01]MBF5000531.1 cutinase family protein [Nocardia sp. BSTN01]